MSVYYRIYSEDGGIPSKTSVTPDDRFLGRIKARSVPPPQILRAVKLTIAKAEDINLNDPTTIDLFHTSHSESPLSGDGRLINTLIVNSQRSTPQEPLALVAKMSDSKRSSLESAREGGLAESNATSPGVRYRTSVQHSYFSFIHPDSRGKCTIRFTPTILTFHLK